MLKLVDVWPLSLWVSSTPICIMVEGLIRLVSEAPGPYHLEWLRKGSPTPTQPNPVHPPWSLSDWGQAGSAEIVTQLPTQRPSRLVSLYVVCVCAHMHSLNTRSGGDSLEHSLTLITCRKSMVPQYGTQPEDTVPCRAGYGSLSLATRAVPCILFLPSMPLQISTQRSPAPGILLQSDSLSWLSSGITWLQDQFLLGGCDLTVHKHACLKACTRLELGAWS